MDSTGSYDDALLRFHRTGPEYDGSLSNHGPMVVEVLARRGQSEQIVRWTDRYLPRLDARPRGKWAIEAGSWRDELGRTDRVTDWTEFLLRELEDDPWRVVLARWWPRLLPGIAAGATHGIIRVGHAVRALTVVESAPRVAELGHALGYWAARWQPVPTVAPTGTRSAADLLPALPRVASQRGGLRDRLAQLDSTPGWARATATLAPPESDEQIPAALAHVIDAVVGLYPRYAQANPTMLVHAATAPNAVAMALPELPRRLWRASLDSAWTASAAVLSAYAPPTPQPPHPAALRADGRDPAAPACVRTETASDRLAQALRHGGEHVLKFADTALRSHYRTGDQNALTAIGTAIDLDA